MAVYDLEEQENIESLKAWWKQYGSLVIAAVVAFVIGVGGVQGWRYYQGEQALKAAELYTEFEEAVKVEDAAKIQSLAQKIRTEFPSSTYAPRAALRAAKTAIDKGERDKAVELLQWAGASGKDESLKALANLRLSAVLLDLGKHDEAVKAVTTPPTEAFAALFADARGDVYMAQGKNKEAADAYQVALDKLPKSAAYRNVVEIKRDSLGVQ
jgi:predicted negative regulator of RcsB-dependent stress response